MDFQDSDAAASQRFHSFKMGGGAPPQSLHTFARHAHGRSRSRNNSISFSSSAPSLAPPAPDSPPLNPNVPPPTKRPGSHHQRRSSVSTRRESAELMGVSLPELPPAHSDDNINLGDKDSIRRRALWALEGKSDLTFSKVEIPEFTSSDTTKSLEFPTKPSFPLSCSGLSGFAGKRDSFGKMFGSTSASKDQLGTLVEEEEEEEEKEKEDSQSPADVEQGKKTSRDAVPPAKISSRHRPASLNLRPLSLVQSSVVSSTTGNLPTPTSTPANRSHTRKPDAIVTLPPVNKTAAVFQTPPPRHFSYTCSDSTSAPCDLDKKRRSSISYKRSADSIPRDMFPLPTPEMTPTECRFLLTSDQESLVEQPLSVADQNFLFRSHHLLLSRITELERTLKNQTSRSRHISHTPDAFASASEPSDEMLQLISDLKAERDELKRDVDGWRQRVSDANKHASMLAKRIESERREAWVARSRLGLLEVEKSGLEKSLETKAAALSKSMAESEILMHERDGMKDEIMKLSARLKDADAAVDECTRLRGALEQERTRRKELEKLLDDAGLLNTPKFSQSVNGSRRRPPFPAKPVDIRPRGLGFQSVDSESSTTDVESADDSFTKAEFTLDAVMEEEVEFSDEENGLAGYEDEEDSDLSFSSPGGSSVGSADELDIKPKALAAEISDSPLLSQPTHQSRASLSKTWTFPRGKTATPIKQDDEVDRFFGCLDDADRSPPLSEEITRSAFSSAFRSMADDDELPPFVLPSDVGVVVESMSAKSLGVVHGDEEDVIADAADDDLVGEEVEGGMRLTFNAPPIICVTPPVDVCVTPPPKIKITPPVETLMTTPAVRPRMDDCVSSKSSSTPERVEDEEDESSLTFVFLPKVQSRRIGPVSSPPRSSPPTSSGGSRPSSRNDSPPSSIPRAISLRSMSPKAPLITFTPFKSVSGRFTAPLSYSTPPAKTLSSTPQPVASPKSCSIPTKAVVSPNQSQPSSPNGSTSKPHSKSYMTNDSIPDLRCPSSMQGGGATSEVNYSNRPDPSSPSVCEYSHARDTSSSLSSIMSNPLAARSPFQKLSHYISFSWTPGATAVASYIVPSSSSGSPSMDAAATAASLLNGTTRPAQRRFVQKARQLEKLRSRFDLEKKNGMPPCSVMGACKGCCAGNVYL